MQNELSDRYLLDSNFIKSSNESAYSFQLGVSGQFEKTMHPFEKNL